MKAFNPFLYRECYLLLSIVFTLMLSLAFKIRNRKLIIQQRRYPLFVLRDSFIKMHLDNKFGTNERFFLELMIFCNRALYVSEEIEFTTIYQNLHKVSQRTLNKTFGETAVVFAKYDKDFAENFGQLINYILWRSRCIAFKKSPKLLLNIVLKESLALRSVKDYQCLRDYNRTLQSA